MGKQFPSCCFHRALHASHPVIVKLSFLKRIARVLRCRRMVVVMVVLGLLVARTPLPLLLPPLLLLLLLLLLGLLSLLFPQLPPLLPLLLPLVVPLVLALPLLPHTPFAVRRTWQAPRGVSPKGPVGSCHRTSSLP